MNLSCKRPPKWIIPFFFVGAVVTLALAIVAAWAPTWWKVNFFSRENLDLTVQVLCTFIAAVGAAFGAIGASSMLWTRTSEHVATTTMHNPTQIPKSVNRETVEALAAELDRKHSARQKLLKAEERKDAYSVIGWGLVIFAAGATFLYRLLLLVCAVIPQ